MCKISQVLVLASKCVQVYSFRLSYYAVLLLRRTWAKVLAINLQLCKRRGTINSTWHSLLNLLSL